MHKTLARIGAAAALWLPATATAAPIVMNGPTSAWTPVLFPGAAPDWANDQATGQPEADIVGNVAHPAFYSAFDDAGTASLLGLGLLSLGLRRRLSPR